jgi:hypothetical protein
MQRTLLHGSVLADEKDEWRLSDSGSMEGPSRSEAGDSDFGTWALPNERLARIGRGSESIMIVIGDDSTGTPSNLPHPGRTGGWIDGIRERSGCRARRIRASSSGLGRDSLRRRRVWDLTRRLTQPHARGCVGVRAGSLPSAGFQSASGPGPGSGAPRVRGVRVRGETARAERPFRPSRLSRGSRSFGQRPLRAGAFPRRAAAHSGHSPCWNPAHPGPRHALRSSRGARPAPAVPR